MKPYYEQDGITIYHGDCRDLTVEVDAVITDPPYGTGKYESDRDVVTPQMFASWTRPVAMFGWPERLVRFCVEAGVVPDEWVTWWASNAACKVSAASLNRSVLPRETEAIAVFGRAEWARLRRARTGTFKFDSARALQNGRTLGGLTRLDKPTARLGDTWTDSAPGLAFQSKRRLHPNEKPLSVMQRLVDALTEPGQTVLDPFMGSGSTLVAARLLGRRAVGCEIVEEHCEIAANRLAQGVLDLSA